MTREETELYLQGLSDGVGGKQIGTSWKVSMEPREGGGYQWPPAYQQGYADGMEMATQKREETDGRPRH